MVAAGALSKTCFKRKRFPQHYQTAAAPAETT
jgi:hypothetical protein